MPRGRLKHESYREFLHAVGVISLYRAVLGDSIPLGYGIYLNALPHGVN